MLNLFKIFHWLIVKPTTFQWSAAIGAGASLLGGKMGADASEQASAESSAAARYAADMQYMQYQQSRQDLSPYRDVAVGKPITEFDQSGYDQAMAAYAAEKGKEPSEFKSIAMSLLDPGNIHHSDYKQQYGDMPKRSDFETTTGYEGGALNTLADYGRSQVSPGDYIPGTDIPTYQGSQIGDLPSIENVIPEYNVSGEIPEFDSTQFDIYKDPSYEWRKEEMLRGLDRTAGATGKITSGNRMEEIMSRTGEMASQEYGAARDRMVQDYDIRRQNEATQFGRDLTGYEAEMQRANVLYGRGVDEYGRAYSRDVDQYGRDLTGYNALVAQESGMYGRGEADYGRAYGQEGDYLNRLSALSNIGQTATNTGVQAGGQAAYYGGQAIQAAGQAQAAGTLGQSSAWTGALGDMASLYGGYNQPNMNYGTAYNYGTNPGSQQTNMLASQWS